MWIKKVEGFKEKRRLVEFPSTNLTRHHEVTGSIPGLAQRVKDLVLP